MKLIELNIKNYKSLANVTLKPSDFTVIIGPNASGKSNFASAVSFLSEVYRYNLETAVKKKGGYENICLRKKKRSSSPIAFSFLVKIDKSESDRYFKLKNSFNEEPPFYILHSFAFNAVGSEIDAEFTVCKEEFKIFTNFEMFKNKTQILHVKRNDKNELKILDDKHKFFNKNSIDFMSEFKNRIDNKSIKTPFSSQQLIFINFFPFTILHKFLADIGNWSVYQFSPNLTRNAGVPTPNPELSLHGENLPAIVDWLKKHRKDNWEDILNTMKDVVPRLTDITTDYLHNKTLGLFFHEDGIGRPWNSEEVSDGTILTLSILCSINDPRTTLVVIEEPENSVHPWIIRSLIENFKKVSKSKNIIITTHSPILIDMLSPEEIWCISKSKGATNLDKLTDLAPALLDAWKNGEYQISEYLDSGLVPNAVPGAEL